MNIKKNKADECILLKKNMQQPNLIEKAHPHIDWSTHSLN